MSGGRGGAAGALLKVVAPLARRHVTAESMQQLFETLTSRYEREGERAMIVLSRKVGGKVVGSVVGVNEENRIVSQYDQRPLDELITEWLEGAL